MATFIRFLIKENPLLSPKRNLSLSASFNMRKNLILNLCDDVIYDSHDS